MTSKGIYQGEPLVFAIKGRDDDGHYIPSLEGHDYEAMLVGNGKVVNSWSTAGGTMVYGQAEEGDETVGYVSWAMSGSETAKMDVGQYTLEVARVVDGAQNRAIGIMSQIISIKAARIKEGV